MPQKAFERQAQGKVALAAVGAIVFAGQERGGQQVAELVLELAQGGLAQGVDGAPAQRGQPGTERGKEGRVPMTSKTTVPIDTPAKMAAMKDTPETLSALKAHYRQLCRRLAWTGYISQGSVQQRSVVASGRSGYQWTRKVAQKTVSVALSQAQFDAMKQAVANERKLWKIIQEMERVSRRIIFLSAPDTRRRKRLSKKVLGLN